MIDKNKKSKKKTKKSVNQMWGGHFSSGPAEIMEKINTSIDVDKKLYAQDIRGSIVHAEMLGKQDIISKEEAKKIIGGLKQIQQEIESGKFQFQISLEDIHMNIESRLKEIIGGTAGKLHTARSRNDQVVTDFKLWVRDAIELVDKELQNLQATLIDRAEKNYDIVMPGFTHLQIAQPITLGHHLLAYAEMFGRDRSRLKDAGIRMNECPLGSAALAGTSFPIDREMTAKNLGFNKPTANSLDSVSDRDFAIEFIAAVSICSTHLSRLAEEIILWVNEGFKFVTLSDAFTTGSSIMPQKRNPDVAELIRAKTGRITGSLVALLTVIKGLPLAYSKDMQEDKEPVFDAAENIMLCIKAMAGMISDMKVNKLNMLNVAMKGYSTATDIADWLVINLSIPFRDAHHITGKIVRLAEERGCRLDELKIADFKRIEPKITSAIMDILSVDNSVKSRNSYGGTAPENVLRMAKEARKKFL